MINIASKFFKVTNIALNKNLTCYQYARFANLKVKVDYSKGEEEKEMFKIVEDELYDQYRRTFGDHTIKVEGNQNLDGTDKIRVELKVNDKDTEKIWDSDKQGVIAEINVSKLADIIDKKIEEKDDKKPEHKIKKQE